MARPERLGPKFRRAERLISLKWSPRGAPSKVRKELDKVRAKVLKDVIGWSGGQIRGIVKRRTQSGLDVEGKPFVDYAFGTTRTRRSAARLSAPKSTGRQPHKELRRRLGYQTAFVDLKMTGGLIGAIDFRETGADTGELIVASSHEKIAEGLQSGRYAREFLGISPRDLKELNSRTDNEIEKRMKRILDRQLFAKAGARHFTSGKAWKRVGG